MTLSFLSFVFTLIIVVGVVGSVILTFKTSTDLRQLNLKVEQMMKSFPPSTPKMDELEGLVMKMYEQPLQEEGDGGREDKEFVQQQNFYITTGRLPLHWMEH